MGLGVEHPVAEDRLVVKDSGDTEGEQAMSVVVNAERRRERSSQLPTSRRFPGHLPRHTDRRRSVVVNRWFDVVRGELGHGAGRSPDVAIDRLVGHGSAVHVVDTDLA